MNEQVTKIFAEVILSDKKLRIKLLGDSITHGVGGTGFLQNGEKIVEGWARNPDGYCWAKQFKEYMESNFNCEVVNNACTGTDIQFVIENFDTLVDEEDDIILCTIGTNNRHQCFDVGPKKTREEFMKILYDNIAVLHGKLKDAGKKVVFMANTPAAKPNEQDGDYFWRILHMNDIANVYQKASFDFDFPLISMYNRFLEYCEIHDIQFETLLADGLHPNDSGYDVMFKILLKEIGISKYLF